MTVLPRAASLTFDVRSSLEAAPITIPRTVVVCRAGETAIVRISMPFVVLLAAHGARTNPDVARCVLEERLPAPIDVDLEALNMAICGFEPMVASAITVRDAEGESRSLQHLKMRLETALVADTVWSASEGQGTMCNVMMDAVFHLPAQAAFDVCFIDMPLPAHHHFMTEILDRRGTSVVPRTWFGPLDNPLRFGPEGMSMMHHH